MLVQVDLEAVIDRIEAAVTDYSVVPSAELRADLFRLRPAFERTLRKHGL